MPELFPRQTIVWKVVEDQTPYQRLAISLPLMALVTGIVLRLYRAYVQSFDSIESWIWIGSTIVIGTVVLLVLLTVHLSHYTVRHWWWRASVFAVLEAVTEILISLAMTLLGMEKAGSGIASLSDWGPSSARIIVIRVLVIIPFTVLLAAVVSVVQKGLVVHERRSGAQAKRATEMRQVTEDPPAPPSA